jgi:N-methylhydantoinase B
MVTGAMALGYTGRLTGNTRVQYELGTTALGGNSRGDGASILHPMNHFTAGSPIEIIESEYPIRVTRFDFWPDSGGPGLHRGGVGVVKAYELLDDATLTLRTTLHRQRSWGLLGGHPPATSRTTLDPGRSTEQRLTALETRNLQAGTIVRLERSGGGGWGSPTERDPELVLADVLDGLVSIDAAAEVYGVVIDPSTLAIDASATSARRATMAQTKGPANRAE